LKDECGLPFGCVVRPFCKTNRAPLDATELPQAENVCRCTECYAYANGYAQFSRYGWTCSLCGAYSEYPAKSKYGSQTHRRSLPELQSELVELEVSRVELDANAESSNNVKQRPITVALVDLDAGEEFIELVKSALLAALEALPPGSLFGLVAFSHKISLYDVQGDVPVVKNVPIPSSGLAEDKLELEDVVPLKRLLAPIGKYKENIVAAIETLRPVPPWEQQAGTAEISGDDASDVEGGRAFGGALEALMDYFGTQPEVRVPTRRGTLASMAAEEGEMMSYATTHLVAFLAGIPNAGPGALDAGRYRLGEDAPTTSRGEEEEEAEDAQDLLEPSTAFYREVALRAADGGVVVDLCVASAQYVDLASLQALATLSGGAIFLYRSLESSTLPQDIYRRLRRPRAVDGVLRLRTSVEFAPVRAYGHFFADEQYENLYHVLSCDMHDTFAFDFEFTNSQGFSQPFPPMLQMVFQYTVMLPVTSEADADGMPTKYILSRRLRVNTVALKLGATPKEVYASADAEAILALLQHKIVRASLEEGIAEGQLLLQDWLVILTAHYNEHFGLAEFGERAASAQLDVAFAHCEALQSLPRLVFALLRSPLLQMNAEGCHPDERVYCQSLYGALEPAALRRSIYPVLSSYKTPDEEAFPRHSLSRAALITSGSPIFLMDTFTSIIVYYAPNAPPELPFPPPQNSKLRQAVNALKGERVITPHLHFIKGGVDSVAPFEAKLLEEQDVGIGGVTPGLGFVGFLDMITKEVRAFMQAA